MSETPQVAPALRTGASRRDHVEGQGPILNGKGINVHKTHPNLYLLIMLSAALNILLGLNFLFLHPTFLIYDQPNYLWGAIFIMLGIGKMVFLNIFRYLKFVRILIAMAFVFVMCIAYGTTQPFIEGEGSLQLPILYAGWAALQLALLFEPFINPWTAKRED